MYIYTCNLFSFISYKSRLINIARRSCPTAAVVSKVSVLTCINHDTIRSIATKGLASAALGTSRESLHMQLARSRETNQPNCCGESEFSRILDELLRLLFTDLRYTYTDGTTRRQVAPVTQVRTYRNRFAMWATSRGYIDK